MHQLQVGDHVLAVNDAGEAFFDEIYFFGHADHKAMSPMVQLQIQDGWVCHGVPWCAMWKWETGEWLLKPLQ